MKCDGIYCNYHRHDHNSNIKARDVVAKPEEYIKRMIELGHTLYFTTEHGYQGNPFETLSLLEESNKNLDGDKKIKMVVGVEAYFVENVQEKDRSNFHLVIIALNNSGVEEINQLMTYANIEGYYYKPRIDFKAIKRYLNPKNVIVTSACVAGIGALWNNESENYIKFFKDYFGDNFYLEIQNHNHEKQIKHNNYMKNLSYRYDIQLIHGNDSHYIYPEDAKYRDLYLKAKGIVYPEEEGFILDYPDYNTILERYKQQGVFSDEEAKKALDNTTIFLDKCEEITIYDKKIKMPQITENPKKELKRLLNEGWKRERNKIPKEKHNEYLKAIRYEVDIIEKTNMEQYFVLDNAICEKAKKDYGCLITKTGRGSCGSFYINKLLGLSGIDRLNSPVTLYPTRFISVSRILETRSLPDIDINVSDQVPMIKASEDILGKEKCGWLITYKPLQASSAFRLWCKANEYDFDEYNNIAKDIDMYREDSKWGQVIEDSKRFVGVIDAVSPSPCSMLLSPVDIDKHIGYIKVGDEICCNLDGYNCDKYKYLKNDILKVTVWEIIDNVYKLIGKEVPEIEELNELLDEKTFDIYKNKLTCTINQADSDYATPLVSRYSPKNVAEMCAFIACIRPSFASLLNNFLDRKPYTTGVKELDGILEDSFHYLMYQESIMKYLIWLGVEEAESYSILKKISKKKFTEKELIELKKKLHKGWKKVVGKEEGFEETWKVVEDASKYSFNSSHSLAYAYDSLYGAYLKAHYPLEYYSVVLNLYKDDMDRTTKLIRELDYFGIKLKRAKFRYSKPEYFFDKETNSIYKGIDSIKFMNREVGEFLYSLKNEDVSFPDIIKMSKGKINSRQWEILIKIGFFEEFGKSEYLLKYYELLKEYGNKKQLKKDGLEFPLFLVKKYAKKETAKLFKEIDMCNMIKEYMSNVDNEDIDLNIVSKYELEYTGNVTPIKDCDPRNCIIENIDEYKTCAYLKIINIKKGSSAIFKAKKGVVYDLKKYDLIRLDNVLKQNKRVKKNGKWGISDSEFEYWITSLTKIS